VACRWRIRHKLLLGLGLIAVLVAVLLGGALKGLDSYRKTIKTLDNKLTSLKKHANPLQALIHDLGSRDVTPGLEARHLMNRFAVVRELLHKYEEELKELKRYGKEPDKSYKETACLQAIHERLEQLNTRVKLIADPNGPARSGSVLQDDEVQRQLRELDVTANDLVGQLYQDCWLRFQVAKEDARLSLTIVLVTTGVGVVFLIGLLRFFYRWIFYPIRDLQEGVGRVGQGNFDHTIQVNSGDEIEDLAAAFNDMTGRLREIYTNLARQVNERSRQLVRSEQLAGVGFLAAGVAHEINNPLASIAFCSEALERRLTEVLNACGQQTGAVGEDIEVVRKYLRLIQQEAFRCKEITQRLLEFSRGGERRREPTDLGELIQGVLDMAKHLPNCKAKKLVFTPPPRLVAWVNAQEIKQVVLNLVVNALDSMEEGGALTITTRQRDGMAEMVFADTGCGMTGEVLENIFEPFFTRSRTGKGTGLGLSISHRIISQHRGEIEAVSPGPNQGSTFTVRVPLQAAAADEQGSGACEPGITDRDQEAGSAGQQREGRRKAA
jgi:two-component system NtrC family sensor kinase